MACSLFESTDLGVSPLLSRTVPSNTVENAFIDSASFKVAWFKHQLTQPYTRLSQNWNFPLCSIVDFLAVSSHFRFSLSSSVKHELKSRSFILPLLRSTMELLWDKSHFLWFYHLMIRHFPVYYVSLKSVLIISLK